MSRLIGVYGASGFGREVIPLLAEDACSGRDRILFIDDGANQRVINGFPVLRWEQFLAEPENDKSVVIAIANSRAREELALRCFAHGVKQKEVRARNVIQMDEVSIKEGSIISHFVTLTSNIRIGRNFHANIYSYIAHDCVIGDFVTFAPRVSCNGNVHIHDHAYIGTGAVIRQGTPDRPLVIGKGAVVGMGAVVTRNVPAGATVVGNPARPLIKD